MKIWITTDTHFNHKQLIEYGRPEDFEDKIKKGLLNNVKPEDLLIHLGDICIGNDIENSNWFKNNLSCKTYLIRGNHDNKSIKWYMENGWDAVADGWILRYLVKGCVLHICQLLGTDILT